MGKPLQLLIAATCIAVMATMGLLWSNDVAEKTAASEAAARRIEAIQFVRDQDERNECVRILNAWRIGGAALIREMGVAPARQRVKECTDLLDAAP